MLARMRGPMALAELEREIAVSGTGLDRLRLMETPFVPEVRLHLAEDAIVESSHVRQRRHSSCDGGSDINRR